MVFALILTSMAWSCGTTRSAIRNQPPQIEYITPKAYTDTIPAESTRITNTRVITQLYGRVDTLYYKADISELRTYIDSLNSENFATFKSWNRYGELRDSVILANIQLSKKLRNSEQLLTKTENDTTAIMKIPDMFVLIGVIGFFVLAWKGLFFIIKRWLLSIKYHKLLKHE